MLGISLTYATPSVFRSRTGQDTLALTADSQRPVRFRGRVLQVPLVRFVLRALGNVLWSFRGGFPEEVLLDPFATVLDDRLLLEAFSADQSAYAAVSFSRELFELEGETMCGTTQVDFTSWLTEALNDMRTSRPTFLTLDTSGLELVTEGAGGRFEPRVELQPAWLRGLSELQGAMAFPDVRLVCQPVDVLSIVRFLRYNQAKISPRALRFELTPDDEAVVILEPWEELVRLHGSRYSGEKERVVRVWGRDRLSLLEPILPFASSVEIFLKGRAMPTFYNVRLPGIEFLLGLSGWTARNWTSEGAFSLIEPPGPAPESLKAELAAAGRSKDRKFAPLVGRGQAFYDLRAREYLARELFPTLPDLAPPPEPRWEEAERMLADATVELCVPEEKRKVRKLPRPEGGFVRREVVFRDWRVRGWAGKQEAEIVINDAGRVIFGQCGCAFFETHLLARGPCAHMLCLYRKSDEMRRDAASSRAVQEEPAGDG